MNKIIVHLGGHEYFYMLDGNPPAEPVELNPVNGCWLIKMGFAGFNSRANNSGGYSTKTGALASIRWYQRR